MAFFSKSISSNKNSLFDFSIYIAYNKLKEERGIKNELFIKIIQKEE
jgi:hypothetical protein